MVATATTEVRPVQSPRVQGPKLVTFRPQCEFDWEFSHAYPLLLVSEVAELFNVCERQVYDLADEGRFLAFPVNAEEAPQRQHLRIVRATCHTDLRAVVGED